MTRRAAVARFSAANCLLLISVGSCVAVSGCDAPPLSSSDFGAAVEGPVPTPPVGVTSTATAVASSAPTAPTTPVTCPDAAQPQTYAVDADGDGWGTTVLTPSCQSTPPLGFVAAGGTPDCNDRDPNRAAAARFCPDADGDGLGDATQRGPQICVGDQRSGWVVDCSDCDDSDASLQSLAYVDDDADGYGTGASAMCVAASAANQPGRSDKTGDCDDTRPDIYPESIAERALDGVNTDCDALDFDFASSNEPASDEQLDIWAANVALPSDCDNGVDLYILSLVLSPNSSCIRCATELVFANRGGRTANVAYRRRVNGTLVEQVPLGKLAPGAWLRLEDVQGTQPGTNEFSISDANPSAECNPDDNFVSLKPAFGDPPL